MNEKTRTAAGRGLAGIVLAAGASRRLGRPKQLVERDGLPLVVQTVSALNECCDLGVGCVLGSGADAVRAVLDSYAVRIIINLDWRDGIASSIRAGVEQVPANARGILLSVCDQPLVGATDYARLVGGWLDDPGTITVAGYGDDYGVPAIFPAACRRELATLSGDRGAKSVIAGASRRRVIEMPAAAFDIDDENDLAGLGDIGGT